MLIEYKKTKILKKKTKFNTVTKTESSVFNENSYLYGCLYGIYLCLL